MIVFIGWIEYSCNYLYLNIANENMVMVNEITSNIEYTQFVINVSLRSDKSLFVAWPLVFGAISI